MKPRNLSLVETEKNRRCGKMVNLSVTRDSIMDKASRED